jgi:hypothetical protein
VENAGLVHPSIAGDQVAPVPGTQQRPHGDGNAVDPGGPRVEGALPDLAEPEELIVRGSAEMSLRNGNRQMITIPGLGEDLAGTSDARSVNTDGFDIYKGLLAGVTTGEALWIEVGAVIKETVTGQVVIKPDHVRRTGVVRKPEDLGFAETVEKQESEEGVLTINPAT